MKASEKSVRLVDFAFENILKRAKTNREIPHAKLFISTTGGCFYMLRYG